MLMKDMNLRILCPVALGSFIAALVACDDSSSFVSPPIELSSDSRPALSSDAEPLSSSEEAFAPVSSSSEEVAPEVSSSSEDVPASSSADVTLPISRSEPEECYKGGASITMVSVENINIACPNGMTAYSADTYLLYRCEGSTLIREYLPPCN